MKIREGVNRPEIKAKISAALKRNAVIASGTFKGKTHSPETKAKISAAHRARRVNEQLSEQLRLFD